MIFRIIDYKIVRSLVISLVVAFSTTAYTEESAHPDVIYHIKVDPALQDLLIRVCFNVSPAKTLRAISDNAHLHLKAVKIDDDNINVKKITKTIDLQDLNNDACIEYAVNLKDTASNIRRRRNRNRNRNNLNDDNLITSVSTWLWLPDNVDRYKNIHLSFEHPANFSVSTPWQLLNRAENLTTFRYVNTPLSWRAYSAFGRFKVLDLKVPGANIRLGILNGTPQVNTDNVRDWIEQGALAITKAYGWFPIPSPQILVVPIGHTSGSPVPWGQVLRGGGTASHLYIDQTRPFSEHKADWTLTHELSHMIHPYMGNTGSWLAEGLASYYQNLLQARIGTLTRERAWEKLHEGFQRGIRQTYAGVTLEDASTNRGWNGTMRIYWSGAAIVLLADLALRQEGSSLDYALSKYQKCCLPSTRLWTTLEFMQKLDVLTDTKIFTGLHNKYVYSDIFPDIESAYQELGLVVVKGKLTFLDNHSSVTLRNKIMTPTVILDSAAGFAKQGETIGDILNNNLKNIF